MGRAPEYRRLRGGEEMGLAPGPRLEKTEKNGLSRTSAPIASPPLRVPRGHGSSLIVPPLGAVPEMVRKNVVLAENDQYDWQGRTLRELAADARRELVQRARRFTVAYRDVDESTSAPEGEPVFLSGHQPQLFHPGVWLKNFALGTLARRHGATGVFLLIDNDASRSTAIRVPSGSLQRPAVHVVPFDGPTAQVPYEEREILDRELFASFGSRVESTIAPFVCGSLMRDFWPLAVQAARENGNLGQCISRARHQTEARWGLSTLELPLSHICSTMPFHWFMAHLLAQLPPFRDAYNASLAEYRRAHRVRSRSHPVPFLGSREQYLEAPFWVWTHDDPRRRPLWVRRRGNRLVLSDLSDFEYELALSADGDAAAAVEQLGALTDQGVALRPKVLITTMFARLLLSDLFLHGIGGAKYDQLTDSLISRFFGRDSPGFLTISGTALLEIHRAPVVPEDLRRIDRLLREFRFHPEQYLDPSVEEGGSVHSVAGLLAKKRRWIEMQLPRGRRLQRHREIVQVNEALQPFLAEKRRKLRSQRARLVKGLRNEAIFGSREYAFCLFPEEVFQNWILDLFADFL